MGILSLNINIYRRVFGLWKCRSTTWGRADIAGRVGEGSLCPVLRFKRRIPDVNIQIVFANPRVSVAIRIHVGLGGNVGGRGAQSPSNLLPGMAGGNRKLQCLPRVGARCDHRVCLSGDHRRVAGKALGRKLLRRKFRYLVGNAITHRPNGRGAMSDLSPETDGRG